MSDDPKQPQGPRNNGGDGGPPKPPARMSRGAFGWLLIAGLAIILLIMFNRGVGQGNRIPISQFWTHIENGDVKQVTIKEDVIAGEFFEVPAHLNSETKKFEVSYLRAADKLEEIRNAIKTKSPKKSSSPASRATACSSTHSSRSSPGS